MYKFRLLPVKLLTLACLVTLFFSSQLIAATTQPDEEDLPILLAPVFKNKVTDDYNKDTHDGLCTALGTLLDPKSPESPPGCSTVTNAIPHSNAPEPSENTTTYSDTSPQPAAQPSTTTHAPTKSPQLNLYVN